MHKRINYLEAIIGSMLIAISLDLFLSPMNIVTGGTAGLAILARNLFGIDTSLFIAIFYVLMILLNLFVFGIKSTKELLFFSILYPIFTKIFQNITSVIYVDYTTSKLTLYLFASLLYGFGNGLVYKNGFVTGGTDILKKIMSKYFHLSMGSSTLILDSIIILTGGYFLGFSNVIYAIIIVYVSSKIEDKLIVGISNNKTFYVITEHELEIRDYIKNELSNGITEISAYGFSNDKKHILMSVVDTTHYVIFKEKILEIDKDAFIIIFDSYHAYYGGEKSGINKYKRFRKEI